MVFLRFSGLFILLAVLSGCTARTPAHTPLVQVGLQNADSSRNQATRSPDPYIRPTRTPEPIESTSLSLVRLGDDLEKFSIEGPDAEKIYQLLELSPDLDPAGIVRAKIGKHFSCIRHENAKFSCSILLGFPAGNAILLQEESALKHAAAEAPQAKFENEYVRIADPSEKGRVTLKITEGYARYLYERLSDETLIRISRREGGGLMKGAEALKCRLIPATEEREANYNCEIELSVLSGSLVVASP